MLDNFTCIISFHHKTLSRFGVLQHIKTSLA
ncbi:hypothetical protein F383_18961 [Gossypium arboreum]|uniref:Uncharacterized protein n=1 Tax=Gossypium arboreum TaxID=29729 RepID=A0A0B0NMV3_GOSAR|nr:hypothetical protein F383_18961 [Gossypium arboreum]